MSESKWTKGEWEVRAKSGFPVIYSQESHTEICSPHFSKGLRFLREQKVYREELMANAHLLAASPSLYQALVNLVDSIEDAGGHDENGDVFDIREACAALAKANPSTLHAAQPKETL